MMPRSKFGFYFLGGFPRQRSHFTPFECPIVHHLAISWFSLAREGERVLEFLVFGTVQG